jgi:hypothetical protein
VESKLGPLGTSATEWPIVPVPGVYDGGEFGGMKIGRGNRSTRRKPQIADGGDGLQEWREAANILNKQSRTADKGWSSSLGVGREANNSSP